MRATILRNRSFASVLLCMALLCVGCETDETTSPILPGQTCFFTVTLSPNPVYQGYSNKYTFTILIEEKNGVGASVTSMKVDRIGDSNAVLSTDQINESEVIQKFGASRLNAFGRLMANNVLECSNCTRENWLVRAEDDKGNHVEYSGTIELIARSSLSVL